MAAVNGVATFSGLALNRVAAGYTLQVNGGGLISDITPLLTVSAGAATQLALVIQPPSSINPGTGFGLTVSAQDSFGNLNTNFVGTVTVTISSNPNNGTLGGTTSLNAVNGVAVFTNLTLSQAGNGYVLRVASPGILPTTTSPINVKGVTSLTLSNSSVLEFRPNGTIVGIVTA